MFLAGIGRLYTLPVELHVCILEQVDFESLPAAILALSQLYASLELQASVQDLWSARTEILLKYHRYFWCEIMCQHLSSHIVNAGESKPQAMLRIAWCTSYFIYNFSPTSVAFTPPNLQLHDAAHWLYHRAAALEKGEHFVNATFATLLFNVFSTRVAVPLREQLFGFTALGCQSPVLSLLSQMSNADKSNWCKAVWFRAVGYRHMAIIRLLMAHGADVNLRFQDGTTALHWMCTRNNLDIATLLVETGAAVNVRDHYHNTPLHWACYYGHCEISKLLLKWGASVKTLDYFGQTPLECAGRGGYLKLVKSMMDACMDVNAPRYDEHTLQSPALYRTPLKITRLLIEHSTHLNAQDDDGQTLLHWACNTGNLEIVKLLIEKGAHIQVHDHYRRTPMDLAYKRCHFEICRLLGEQLAIEQNRRVIVMLQQNIVTLLEGIRRAGPIGIAAVVLILALATQVYLNATPASSVDASPNSRGHGLTVS